MTDTNKEPANQLERCDLNVLASNAKESYDKLKELNRAVVKKRGCFENGDTGQNPRSD